MLGLPLSTTERHVPVTSRPVEVPTWSRLPSPQPNTVLTGPGRQSSSGFRSCVATACGQSPQPAVCSPEAPGQLAAGQGEPPSTPSLATPGGLGDLTHATGHTDRLFPFPPHAWWPLWVSQRPGAGLAASVGPGGAVRRPHGSRLASGGDGQPPSCGLQLDALRCPRPASEGTAHATLSPERAGLGVDAQLFPAGPRGPRPLTDAKVEGPGRALTAAHPICDFGHVAWPLGASGASGDDRGRPGH